MKKWIVKAVVQKTISFLPFKHRINFLFQKYITKGVRLSDEYFLDKLIHFKHHRNFAKKYLQTLDQIQVFELGTGWYPVIPIAFFLNNVSAIMTVDIAGLLSKQGLETTLKKFLAYHKSGQLKEVLVYEAQKIKDLEQILAAAPQSDLSEILAQLKIQYIIGDAAELSFEEPPFDLLVSNNTFEHVYPQDLERLLKAFTKMVKDQGLMVHFIDMSDHFAHLDKTITIYNFLQFSAAEWSRIDNTIQPQNRWRISQYRALYQQLDISIEEELLRPGDLEALLTVELEEEFTIMEEAEVAVSHGYLVSKM